MRSSKPRSCGWSQAWVIGILKGLSLLLSGWVYSAMDSRLNDLRSDITATAARERIAVLENEMKSQKDAYYRLETKIDKILSAITRTP